MINKPLGYDFDAHATALRETGAEVIFTARSQSTWHLHRYQLKHLALEFRSEGGASIVAGTLAPDSITFAVISTVQAKGAVLNGQRIGPLDLVVIPPALKFIKTSLGPHAWILVSISSVDLTEVDDLSDLRPLTREKQLIVIRSPTLSQQVINIASMIEREIGQDVSAPTHPRMSELEQSLIDTISAVGQVALLRIDETSDLQRTRSTRPYQLAQNAVGLIGTAELQHCHVADLCEALGATERELRRSFKSFFVMGPTRLARLHKVNRIRRMLVDGVRQDTKIMDLLAAADISEPGRFSGEYKALFGETPSVTRKRLAAGNRSAPA